MNKFMLSIGILATTLLSACDNSQVLRDENSQFFSVPLGSAFTLNREITVQPDQTSVYLQHGRIARISEVDFYQPNCKFELYTISEQARVVNPDTFVVTRIVDLREDVSKKWPAYAALNLASGDGDGDGGPIHLTFSTTMYLESKIQPDVFRMNCKQWDWPSTGDFLSINQMRQALGDYFSLKLAE